MAETTFAKAASFLAPVLRRESIVKAKGQSIIQCLDGGGDTKDDTIPELRRKIIEKALALLLEIHACLSQKAENSDSPNSLQSPSQQKTVDGLLDLISLEGIYPFLSPGVGVPIERRVRSVLRGGLVSKPSPAGDGAAHKDKRLLAEICDGLYGITKNEGIGLAASLQQRTLVDLIAGLGELAYASLSDDQDSERKYDCMLRSLLDRTPTRVLFPVLTSLLQPATPEWFRAHVSTHLSFLPLRFGGIKQTINFIAGSAPPEFQDSSARSDDRLDQPHSSSLSLEVITQASRLLSSVPSSMTAEAYFVALAPELLQLLSDPNSDTQRASAYIIGNGVLGRRKYGSPGTVGWRIFAEPIIQSLNPVNTEQGAGSKPMVNVDKNGLRPVVVAEDKIRSALQQLTSLVLLHPNPGLTKRLISPCWRSLWGLLCYSKESNRSGWVDRIHQILCTYIKTSVGVEKLMILSDELLWDGEPSWTYGSGASGGIEIQERFEDPLQRPNMITMMQNIDNRVDELVRLLKSGVADDDEIGSLFVHVSKCWLLDSEDAKSTTNRLEPGEDAGKDPLQSLVYAKLTQKMLGEYKDKLAATPKRIIELVSQLLSAYNVEHEKIRTRRTRASIPSLAGLGTIVDANLAIEGDANAPERPRDEDSTEMISVALSLLVAILSSPEFALDPETSRLLDSLRKSLAHITTHDKSFPASISMTALNILAIVDLHRSLLPDALHNNTKRPPDPHADDRKAHQQALTYLTDPLPPIRAQGIALLTSLITKSSPTLDIPSTTILLQSLLQDEDEFIYLSAIKALGQLASRHPKAVVKRLVEQYVDVAEDAGLDVRIRTGEALLKAVESLGSALAGDVAKMVGEGMIIVAGRRGKKPKARESRRLQRQQAEQSKKEADEAWGGEAPDSSDLGHLDAERNTAAADEEEEEKLLHAWTSPRGDDGDEDDTRMRASALSILGAAIEAHLAGLGPRLVCTALDLVVATLRFEPGGAGGAGGAETAILRRAAVLLVLSLLRALDGDATAGEETLRELNFGLLLGPGAEELHNVLRELESRERDVIVLGHVRRVLDRLESSKARVLLGQDRAGRGWAPGAEGGLGVGLDQVKGFAVDVRSFEKGGSRPKPIIEEIE